MNYGRITDLDKAKTIRARVLAAQKPPLPNDWVPTPSRYEANRTAATGAVVLVKTWDRSPINQNSFDPTQPPLPVLPPASTALPTLGGSSLRPGSVLTSTDGVWTGADLTFARQWLNDGADIPGAIASSYTVAETDVGGHLSIKVVATNVSGIASAESLAVGPVPAVGGRDA
jgi:hypothetical protein